MFHRDAHSASDHPRSRDSLERKDQLFGRPPEPVKLGVSSEKDVAVDVQTASVFKEPLNVTLKKNKNKKESVQGSLKGEDADAAAPLISALRLDDLPIANIAKSIPEKASRAKRESRKKEEEEKKAHVSQRLRRVDDTEEQETPSGGRSSSKEAPRLKSSGSSNKNAVSTSEKKLVSSSFTPFHSPVEGTSSADIFALSREASELLSGETVVPAPSLLHSLPPHAQHVSVGAGSSSTNGQRRNSRHKGEKGSARSVGGREGRGSHTSETDP